MLAALVHLARALGLRVLAKGVQHGDQLTVLNSLGCDEYQGELFSNALQAAPMLALLEQAGRDIPLTIAPGPDPGPTFPLPKNEDKVDEQHDRNGRRA